tara:strand:- start:5 stop:448 length:444 start_codon:yes stop_codon:yes gene_type:complete
MSRVQVVRFVVGERHYALDVMVVKEVVVPKQAQPVVGQPPFVEGLVELRGDYVPLIDLRRRFGAPAPGRDARLLVLSCLQREIALLVDSVGEVAWIDTDRLRPAPVNTSSAGAQAVEAIADIDGTMVMLLAGEALLSEAEWAQVLPL